MSARDDRAEGLIRRPSTTVAIGLAKAALLLLSAVLSLLVAEVAVRIVLPQQLIEIRPDIWTSHEGLGWVVRPSIDTTINTGERSVRVRTDRDGFRIGEAGRISGDCEILLLGDSFMQALQVEHEQSLAGLIEAQLPGRIGGASVAVRNAGVDGWDPNQYLIRTRERLHTDSPDAIVVSFYLGNDMIRSVERHVKTRMPVTVHSLHWPRSLRWKEFVDAVFAPINDWLEVRSHLFVLVKTRLRGLRIMLGLSADYIPVGVQRAEVDDPMWATTAGALQELAAAAEASGRPVLFVLIPSPFAINEAVFAEIQRGFEIEPEALDPHQPEHLIRALLEEAGLRVVSVREAFERAHDLGTNPYGEIDRHLSPEGHELVYEAIRVELDRMTSSCRLGG